MSAPHPQAAGRPVHAVDIVLLVAGGIVTATASLSAITALTDLHPAIPVVLAVISALAGATQMTLRGWVQGQAVPVTDVVEVVSPDGRSVVAGEANEVVAYGQHVRAWEPFTSEG